VRKKSFTRSVEEKHIFEKKTVNEVQLSVTDIQRFTKDFSARSQKCFTAKCVFLGSTVTQHSSNVAVNDNDNDNDTENTR
jgi:hypothetical protein